MAQVPDPTDELKKTEPEAPQVQSDKVVIHTNEEVPIDWSAKEERRAIRKVDLCILPLVMAGFFSLQIDRGNIGSALTSGLRDDLHIDQNIVNNGQTILYAFIIAGEIPSNLLLQRIGATWWLTGQMVVWGLIATLQCTMKTKEAFYAFRALLGLAESGFIPGGVYYISTFYTRKEMAARIGLYWIGNYIGKGCSGLLAAGILSLGNHKTFREWQWLFLIEGVMTLFIGLLALLLLPRSTVDSRTRIPGFNMLTDRESHILTNRLIIDNPSKQNAHKIRISFTDVLKSIATWRVHFILFFALCWTAPISALETYSPTIIQSLGFGKIASNALSSVGYWLQVPVLLLAGMAADRFNKRGLVCLALGVPFSTFMGTFFHFQSHDGASSWARYVLLQGMVAFSGSAYMMGMVWITLNARTPTKRSVFSALYVIFTNLAQIIGSQLFRAQDAPKYIRGLTIALILLNTSMFLVLVALAVFWYSNKKELGEAGLPEMTAETDLYAEDVVDHHQGRAVVAVKFKYCL